MNNKGQIKTKSKINQIVETLEGIEKDFDNLKLTTQKKDKQLFSIKQSIKSYQSEISKIE